jgi:undecaprenyl diphosphate synthase
VLKGLVAGLRKRPKAANFPRHIAIAGSGSRAFAQSHRLSFEQASALKFRNIKGCIETCVKHQIPMLTIHLLPLNSETNTLFPRLMDALAVFFADLKSWAPVHAHQIRISVLGKWYDLPGRVVESIKDAVQSTRDYDAFHVNFCVNYDGHEEIVDACKIVARQVLAGKLDPDHIDARLIKENSYSSNFVPPDLLVRMGTPKLGSLLLWDAPSAKIYVSSHAWQEFTARDLLAAVAWWQKN